jgi:hypothetical protein
MRTTIRVDDELLERLRAQARRENLSLARVLNRTLRAGLRAARTRPSKPAPYRERVYAMGAPRIDLDKALAVASALEDDEIVRKLAQRK